MDKTLDEIFIKYNTDKGSNLGHNYSPLYEKYLPKKVNKFLEIGAWKGAGIKSFKEWYNHEGMFYAMDLFTEGWDLITPEQLQAEGINHFKGSQSDMYLLNGIKEQFTVIVDDGSHHTYDMITTFKHLFVNNLESGGMYIVEDCHDYKNDWWRQGIVTEREDTLMGVIKKFVSYNTVESKLITRGESEVIVRLIDEAFVHETEEILFIRKK